MIRDLREEERAAITRERLVLSVLGQFLCSQTLGTHRTATPEKGFEKMSWTDALTAKSADPAGELTELRLTDRAADGSDRESDHVP